MLRVLILFASFSCLNIAYADNKTTLYDFRFWQSPEHTRIVIDLEKGAKYKIKQNKNKIDLSIENAKLLSRTYKKLFYKDKRVLKTNILRKKNVLHIYFKTAKKYKIKSYPLPPNERYKHHRLVIDIYDKQPTKVVKRTPVENTRKVIVVDAGHGGEDSGAVGYRRSKEKNINLSIAKKLATKINRNKKFRAVLTRSGDYYVPLTKRIRIAKAKKADLFISIHADAVKRRSAKGSSVYTLSDRGGLTGLAKQLEQSENTADKFGGVESIIKNDKFLNKIIWDFSREDRDIQSQKLASKILSKMRRIGYLHKKTPQKAAFVVLKTPAIPSVLVETAFISNIKEERRLNSKKEQDKIANAIYLAIVDYYK